jgi:Tol biopolymer transport system component
MKAVAVAIAVLAVCPGVADAAFPGPNGPIAYVSSRGGPPVPMVVDPGDTPPRAVGRAGEVGPAWSPDGASLAVASATLAPGRGGPTIFEIVTMRADGADRMPLTTDRAQDYDPAWSADGRRIAYSRTTGDNRDIWVVDADGGGTPERLTRAPADDSLPAWAPDGTQIAFTRTRANDGEIYVMNADGSGLHNITKRHGDDEDPDWAPDGSSIAFTRYGEGATADIWTTTATGARPRPLVRSPFNDTQPAWSPDGTRLAFTSNRRRHDDIWTIPVTGGRPVDVTPDAATDDSPAWGVRSAIGHLGAVPGLRPASSSGASGPSV